MLWAPSPTPTSIILFYSLLWSCPPSSQSWNPVVEFVVLPQLPPSWMGGFLTWGLEKTWTSSSCSSSMPSPFPFSSSMETFCILSLWLFFAGLSPQPENFVFLSFHHLHLLLQCLQFFYLCDFSLQSSYRIYSFNWCRFQLLSDSFFQFSILPFSFLLSQLFSSIFFQFSFFSCFSWLLIIIFIIRGNQFFFRLFVRGITILTHQVYKFVL